MLLCVIQNIWRLRITVHPSNSISFPLPSLTKHFKVKLQCNILEKEWNTILKGKYLIFKDVDHLNSPICIVMPCQSACRGEELGKINYNKCLCTLWQNHCELYLRASGLSEVWSSRSDILLSSIKRIEAFSEYYTSMSNMVTVSSFHLSLILVPINEKASLKLPLLCCRILDTNLYCSMWESVNLYFWCFKNIWKKQRPKNTPNLHTFRGQPQT